MRWNVHKVDVIRYTEEDAGLAYLAVELHATSDDGGHYIEFQSADDEDERDSGYCIVDNPPDPGDTTDVMAVARLLVSHATLYGGLLESRLVGNDLTFVFDDKAQLGISWPPRCLEPLRKVTGRVAACPAARRVL